MPLFAGRFCDSLHGQLVVYYQPMTEAEAIKLNESQWSDPSSDYPLLEPGLNHYEPWLRESVNDENLFKY